MEFVPIVACGMNKKNWPRLSFDILQEFFADHDYIYSDIGNQFRKDTELGWQNIILGFSAYEDQLFIEVSFGVRLNIVENLIAPYTHGLRGYQAESNTTITNLSKYLGEPYFRFKIEDEADLYRMAAHVRDFFRREGFQFLDKLSCLDELDKQFNNHPQESSLVSFNHQLRSFRGLAVASLNQNPHWEELCSFYRNLLQRYSSPLVVMDRYRDFSRHLATTALN